MHILVTCKYKKDQIKTNRDRVETSFFPLLVNGGGGGGIRVWKCGRRTTDHLYTTVYKLTLYI